ncbi:acyltransferase family protein [Undibacterium sp. Ji42W]|uniref:acyltransferase family protein n=1 Tax=Undibacterium sp. Ji42W TaxID=3413039 RepID=UPI003BF389F2
MNTLANKPPGGRYQYIDFLRGFAALLVIYQHTIDFASMAQANVQLNAVEVAIAHFFSKQIGIGEIGVCIFLMVSGFVVPFSLSTYPVEPVKTFVIHRFFRLYPVYWLSVVLGLIFVWWRFGVSQGGNNIDWLMFFTNLTMFQAFVGIDNIIGSYWTLALELLFYFFCIYLFSRGKMTSLKNIVLLMLAVLLLPKLFHRLMTVSAYSANVLFYLRYIGYMFFGLLYRDWLLNKDSASGMKALFVLVWTFLIFTGRDILHFWTLDTAQLRSPAAQLIAITIFILTTTVFKIQGKLGSFLGKISYSMYLFHPVIFYPLYTYVWRSLPTDWQSHPNLFFVMSALLTIAFSYCTYRWLEEPSIALGKKLTRQRQTSSLPPISNMKVHM